ncbi:MAG TPA: hypothetical protein PLU49_04575 [Saprospiraceae bacterium]|nr:hypothetical protein [Saprospiraceae bacterium]
MLPGKNGKAGFGQFSSTFHGIDSVQTIIIRVEPPYFEQFRVSN